MGKFLKVKNLLIIILTLIGLIGFFTIFFLFQSRFPDRKSVESDKSSIKTKGLVGIMGVFASELSKTKSLEPSVVSVTAHLSSSELQSALETTKSLNIGLIGRFESYKKWQKDGYKPDLVKLKSLVSAVFSGNKIASDPDFLGYYLIDEPCHESKWEITPEEFSQIYEAVKAVNHNIKVLVNFGHLGCLANKVPKNKEKITDIATFVITPKKLRSSSDYIKNEDSIAQKMKEIYPNLQIVPLIAVYEFPRRNEPLPSAAWIRQIGMEVLSYDNFDGVIYFPWSPSRYMGDVIRDVADYPEYARAFEDVFNKAKEKFGS